jgi:hypothetical protein
MRPATVSRAGRSWAGLVVPLLLALLSPLAAQAAPPPRRVTVLHIQGPGQVQVHRAITRVLGGRGYRLVAPDEFDQTAAALKVSSTDPDGMAAVATRLELTAVITGRVRVRRSLHTVVLAVHDPRTGAILDEGAFAGRSAPALARAVTLGFWKRLGPAFSWRTVGRTRSAPPPRREPEATPAAPATVEAPPVAAIPRRPIDEEPPFPPPPAPAEPPVVVAPSRPRAPPPDRPATGPATIELSVGPRVLYRQLTYDTDPDDALTPFRTRRPTPALGLEAAWFPRLVTPRLGLAGALEYGAPLESRSSADLAYQLPNSDALGSLLIGLATRFATVDLALGAGRQRFGVVPEGAAVSRPRLVPDVFYQYLRAGLAARIYTRSRLGLNAGVYYRHLLGTGAIASDDWFPSLRALGAEARLGVSYRFLPALEARLQGDLRLYRLTVDPEDRSGGHITAGALDQYWSAWLAVAVLLGGEGERR